MNIDKDKEQKYMKTVIVIVFVFGGIAIISASLSAFIFFVAEEVSSAFGIISSIMSVVLSIAAMVYTYLSGKETFYLLKEIEKQNKILVDKINQDLLKDAYDEKGIEDARESIAGILNRK